MSTIEYNSRQFLISATSTHEVFIWEILPKLIIKLKKKIILDEKLLCFKTSNNLLYICMIKGHIHQYKINFDTFEIENIKKSSQSFFCKNENSFQIGREGPGVIYGISENNRNNLVIENLNTNQFGVLKQKYSFCPFFAYSQLFKRIYTVKNKREILAIDSRTSLPIKIISNIHVPSSSIQFFELSSNEKFLFSTAKNIKIIRTSDYHQIAKIKLYSEISQIKLSFSNEYLCYKQEDDHKIIFDLTYPLCFENIHLSSFENNSNCLLNRKKSIEFSFSNKIDSANDSQIDHENIEDSGIDINTDEDNDNENEEQINNNLVHEKRNRNKHFMDLLDQIKDKFITSFENHYISHAIIKDCYEINSMDEKSHENLNQLKNKFNKIKKLSKSYSKKKLIKKLKKMIDIINNKEIKKSTKIKIISSKIQNLLTKITK